MSTPAFALIACIDTMLIRANRRSRTRTLGRADVQAVLQAVQVGAPWATRDGGAVANSYNFPAETTAVLAVRRSDGAIVVGATRMATRRLVGGGGPGTDVSVARGPWAHLGPWVAWSAEFLPGSPSPESPSYSRSSYSDFASRLEAWAQFPSTDRVVLAEDEATAALVVLAGGQAVVMEVAS